MYSSSELPWMKIHEFLLNVENVHDPREFCVQVVKRIYPLIPYDQARVYFINDNGKIYDEVLIGVEQRWSDIYREYYSRIENGRYSISTRIENIRYSIPARTESGRYVIPELKGSVYDWTHHEGDDEFIANYIRPQRLRYSAGFGFYDADSFMKSMYTLDRTSRSGYTHEEIDVISIVQAHLDNLHKNLFVLASTNRYIRNPEIQQLLTKRESEIAELLCRGMTPIKISHRLFLSLPTVYRHIANIHTKLNVSNRQELLLRLMGRVELGEN